MSWTKDEFKTYVLIYAMNANYMESKDQVEEIKEKIGDNDLYKKMHREFDRDNDYQSLNKMEEAFHALDYSKNDLDRLFKEINDLFMLDGEFESTELEVLLALKHIFK